MEMRSTLDNAQWRWRVCASENPVVFVAVAAFQVISEGDPQAQLCTSAVEMQLLRRWCRTVVEIATSPCTHIVLCMHSPGYNDHSHVAAWDQVPAVCPASDRVSCAPVSKYYSHSHSHTAHRTLHHIQRSSLVPSRHKLTGPWLLVSRRRSRLTGRSYSHQAELEVHKFQSRKTSARRAVPALSGNSWRAATSKLRIRGFGGDSAGAERRRRRQERECSYTTYYTGVLPY